MGRVRLARRGAKPEKTHEDSGRVDVVDVVAEFEGCDGDTGVETVLVVEPGDDREDTVREREVDVFGAAVDLEADEDGLGGAKEDLGQGGVRAGAARKGGFVRVDRARDILSIDEIYISEAVG